MKKKEYVYDGKDDYEYYSKNGYNYFYHQDGKLYVVNNNGGAEPVTNPCFEIPQESPYQYWDEGSQSYKDVDKRSKPLTPAQLEVKLERQADDIAFLHEKIIQLERTMKLFTDVLSKPGAKIAYDNGELTIPPRNIDMEL